MMALVDQQQLRLLAATEVAPGDSLLPHFLENFAADTAATLEHMASFAHLADVVPSHLFDLYYDATLGNDDIRAFLASENPAALAAMEDCFRRLDGASLWVTRRHSILASLREAS